MKTQRENLLEILENYKDMLNDPEHPENIETFLDSELEKFNVIRIGDHEEISSIVPSLRNLCLKLDREVWAKVEAHIATQSWGREQSGLLIIEFLREFEIINLTRYSEFLETYGFVDSDWREENAIDGFLYKK